MNRERVQMLRDMIAGIPENLVDLSWWYKDKDGAWLDEPETVTCGTIACIAGWANIYPPFIAMGIKEHSGHVGARARIFFQVSPETFSCRQANEYGSHKEIALRRLDGLLKARTDSDRVEAQ